MRMSSLFGATLHTAPGRSESAGHQMLQRAGMVRQVGQGIFALLPLGLAALRRIEAVLREEMAAAGAQEVSLPVVNPADLWRRSGRYQSMGPELARFRDRRERDLVLAMTHEEVVTDLAGTEIESYRDLPRTVFQLQTKFRDDPRPRAGLIRVREFVMKDAYSFDADEAGLDVNYRTQYLAYLRVFARLGLPVTVVASDTGMMGGSLAHEFMYLTPVGEDTLLLCDGCGYAANREVAAVARPEPHAPPARPYEEVATPDSATVEALAGCLGIGIADVAKAVFLAAEDAAGATRYVVAVVRGDTEVNETKLANLVGAVALRPMTEEEITGIGAVAGYGSPVGTRGATVVVDDLVAGSTDLVAGANRYGYHLRHVVAGRDYAVDHAGDITAARAGDPCPRCRGPLRTSRGVEVGQIFKLGTRYSAALEATFLDRDGQRRPLVMGCYGIGVGRLLACLAEEYRDGQGLRLPVAAAAYPVHLTLLDGPDSAVGRAATGLYDGLRAAGVEVLFDDRDERAGVKFADADLIGSPLRITMGRRAFGRGEVELRERATGESAAVGLDRAVAEVLGRLAGMRAALDGRAGAARVPDDLG